MTKVICGEFGCINNNNLGDCLLDRIYICVKKKWAFPWLGKLHSCKDYVEG